MAVDAAFADVTTLDVETGEFFPSSLSYRPYLHESSLTHTSDNDISAVATAYIYADASLVQVYEPQSPPPTEDEARRRETRNVILRKKKDDNDELTTRGAISGFSHKSRQRMNRAMNRIRRDADGLVFLTLTYPDGLKTDGRAVKDDWRRFARRLGDRWEGVSMLWRMEVKKRKTGAQEGEPVAHFHVLVCGLPWLDGMPKMLFEMWSDTLGVKSALVDAELARSADSVKAYMSKIYMSKEGDDGDGMIETPGRFWGIINKKAMPMYDDRDESVAHPIAERSDVAKFLRIMRGYTRAQYRIRYKALCERAKREGWKREPTFRRRRMTSWRSFYVRDPIQFERALPAWGDTVGAGGEIVRASNDGWARMEAVVIAVRSGLQPVEVGVPVRS